MRRCWLHARLKWRCAPPSSPWRTTSRWRCWCLPPARSAAHDKLPRPFRQLAGTHRNALRFRSAKEQAQILEQAAEGKIDILIGTHKLLQSDVKFKDLGLLIVDEEHRFGVRHKERIKAMRADVDILTLTATPIPRTLNMAMSGMRDLSIIATPPARRLAVKTFVREYDSLVVARRSCVKFCAADRFIICLMTSKTFRKPLTGWQSWCRKRGSPSVTGRCASANWNG